MITVGRVKFKRIPDYFLERYDSEIAAWAKNFAKIGPIKAFVLKEGYLSNPSPNPEAGAELIQVKLWARLSRRGVEIEPYTKRDEDLIRKHCTKMITLGVPSRARLVEPERPWIPFLPTIGSA